MEIRRKYTIKAGDSAYKNDTLEIHITGSGKSTYIWIGCDSGPCFGHLSGPKTLESLANNILKALKSKS